MERVKAQEALEAWRLLALLHWASLSVSWVVASLWCDVCVVCCVCSVCSVYCAVCVVDHFINNDDTTIFGGIKLLVP